MGELSRKEAHAYKRLVKERLQSLGSQELNSFKKADPADVVKEGVRLYYQRCRELHHRVEECDSDHKAEHKNMYDATRLEGAVARLHRHGSDFAPKYCEDGWQRIPKQQPVV